ncbi:mediator of RNA polymerase II transcription subunit 17-like [Ostrinia furnacalis]|uniref:mediator of RNA polymerase II transcription subunit 17-like n=1 Tax=Ostrinia furnacalis TaxID=93504 RepID=UPI00103C4986|nr:mediator of RNA polymerase II transcription subunit 17-like [Ostrinia furnacalis]
MKPEPKRIVGNYYGLYNYYGELPEGAAGKSDHDHVLEHSLHQLLRAVHHANTHHPFPHPATGPLGPSKRRCLAGPMAADRHELLEMSREQSLLEQIIQQAQHFFMRRRSEYVLDTIAKEVPKSKSTFLYLH